MRVPRPYQSESIEAIRAAFRRNVRGVAVEQATGTGKGLVIAAIAKDAVAKGSRVLILVNRDNLCDQLTESVREQGLFPAVERGMDQASPFSYTGKGMVSNVVVGSIQTLQGKRLEKWPRSYFNLIITDEAHGAAADTFKNTLSHFESGWHVFFSATIERHDKAPLWKGVTELVYSYPLMKAIADGWLVPFDFEELPVPITISDKQQAKKMWTEKDEAEVFSTHDYLPRLFAEAAIRVRDKHALFFWPNCDSSMAADVHFKTLGMESMHVEGLGGPAGLSRAKINELLEWFRQPGAKALHNADLLSYGADFPMIDCVGIMRLSRSIPMLKQRLGRGTRPMAPVDQYATAEERRAAIASSVKPTCKILDLMLQLGEVQNKFADATMLITEDDEERRFLREEMKKGGVPISMDDLENKLRAKRRTDKEEQLAKLAEDAANAANRRGLHEPTGPIDLRWIEMQYNPNHKPATPGFTRFIKRLCRENGVELFPGPYTGFQLFKVKDKIESIQQAKQRELVS